MARRSSRIEREVVVSSLRDLGAEAPETPEPADHVQSQLGYPSDLFITGTDPLPMFVAPWDGLITFVAMVISRTISGGPATVDFRIEGGSSIASFNTGAGTKGLRFSEVLDPPVEISALELLEADSDGNATGQSSVICYAGIHAVGT